MIVIVTGGRNYADWGSVHRALYEASPDLVITGGCNCKTEDPYLGADRFARNWCERFGHADYGEFPALWSARGRGAGPHRNALMVLIGQMLKNAGATVEVFAFPGGSGTADMLRKSQGRLVVRVFQ